MAEVKDRIKQLVDQLTPEGAVEVEQLLNRLAQADEGADWQEVTVAAFSGFFDDTEVEYTEDDLPQTA